MSQTCQLQPRATHQAAPLLFDHMVGEQLERIGHGEAKGCCGLEINDEFIFERELNRQIARICASQNLVYVRRGRSRLLKLIEATREQSTALRVEAGRK